MLIEPSNATPEADEEAGAVFKIDRLGSVQTLPHEVPCPLNGVEVWG